MLLNDNTNNCTFYDKHFIDDLYPHVIRESSSALTIDYTINSNIETGTVDLSTNLAKIIALINSSTLPKEPDVWYPLFVTLDTSITTTRDIFNGSASKNKNLGIENFITFDVNNKLQSWNINGNTKLSIDWIINSNATSLDLEYGVLCWYKNPKAVPSTPPPELSQTFLPMTKIPINSVIRANKDISYSQGQTIISISTTTALVKKDNDTLLILDVATTKKSTTDPTKDLIEFTSNPPRYFILSKYLDATIIRQRLELESVYQTRRKTALDAILFKVFDTSGQKTQTETIALEASLLDLNLWIANGDSFSYFKNPEDKKDAITDKRVSWSYLSPCLYPIYREIYNILSLHHVKYINKSALNRKQTRLFKKLCQVLATGPTLDRVAMSYLSSTSIRNIVSEYLTGEDPATSKATDPYSLDKSSDTIDIASEITKLGIVVGKISTKLKDISNYSKNNLSNNIISTKTHLFKKLLSKYGAKLDITTDTVLTFKDGLTNGPHFKMNQDLRSKCKKELTQTILYNNIVVTAGKSTIESKITDSSTSFNVRSSDSTEPKASIDIPIWDIAKKETLKATFSIPVSAGSDIVEKLIDINNPENERPPGEISFQLPDSAAPYYEFDILGGDGIIIKWELISGPDCLRFSDVNLYSPSIGARFATSSDPKPIIYVKSPGKYVVQLTATASFGSVVDSVVIYVVNKQGYYSGTSKPGVLNKASYAYLDPPEGLVVLCPDLRSFALSKYGVFWPTNAGCSVYSKEKNPWGNIASFGDSIKKYCFDIKSPVDSLVPLSIAYKPNNTTMSISYIKLSHMMDNNRSSYQCDSFFKNAIGSEGFVIDGGQAAGFALIDNLGKTTQFDYPLDLVAPGQLSSYGGFSKKIISDIGVDIPFHPKSGVTDLDTLGKLLPTITGGASSMSKPDNILCYLQDIPITGSIKFEKGVFHPFSGWYSSPKCVDPIYSGYQSPTLDMNKGSVLKFEPGRRKVFTFKGQGFYDLNNSYTSDSGIPRTYISSIVLSVDDVNKDCKKPGVEPEPCSEGEVVEFEKHEFSDHDINYGYRNVGGEKYNSGKSAVFSDEFGFSSSLEIGGGFDEYCVSDNKTVTYSNEYFVTSRGPYINDDIRKPEYRHVKALANMSIKDIEVEISFMNYANTKDLILWLDVKVCSKEAARISKKNSDRLQNVGIDKITDSLLSGAYKQPITGIESLSNTPENKLRGYLLDLIHLNDNPQGPQLFLEDDPDTASDESLTPIASELPKSSTYRLYLMNQEHLAAYRYHSSLKFSDHTHINTRPANNNNTKYFFPSQIIAREEGGIIHLLPSISASGYSDYESRLYQNILQTNKLQAANNRFLKFRDMPLFAVDAGEAQFSSTTFSLGVGIVGETDDMRILDRVVNQDSILGTVATTISNQSSLLINSICCWNLILHTSDTPQFLPTNSLGQIDYTSDAPSFPGHSFIANFKDRQHLIPPVNLNGGEDYIFNTSSKSTCVYAKEAANLIRAFPPELNLPPMADRLAGMGSAFAAYVDEFSQELIGFFAANRRYEAAQVFANALYTPNYARFPYGAPGKALVNISKDGLEWYKAEASMFKYSSSHVLTRQRYQYIRLHKDILPSLSNFPYTIVSSFNELIDSSNIKSIYIPTTVGNITIDITLLDSALTTERTALDVKLVALEALEASTPRGDTTRIMLDIGILMVKIQQYESTLSSLGPDGVEPYDILSLTAQTTLEENGLYLVDSSGKTMSKIITDGLVSFEKYIKLLQTNGLLNINGVKFDFTPITPAATPAAGAPPATPAARQSIIQIVGLRAYHFFDVGDSIVTRIPTLVLGKMKIIDTLVVIKAKFFIFKDNVHKTIFIVGSTIPANGAIAKKTLDCDTILLLKTNSATSDSSDLLPFHKWPFVINNDDLISHKTPDQNQSSVAEGSYGTGSVVTKPLVLSSIPVTNSLKSLAHTVNRKETDRMHRINLQILNISGVILETTTEATPTTEATTTTTTTTEHNVVLNTQALAVGYGHNGQDDSSYELVRDAIVGFVTTKTARQSDADFEKAKTKMAQRTNEQLGRILADPKYRTAEQHDSAEFMFLDLKSTLFSGTTIPDFGEIILNDDLRFDPPTYKFTSDEITKLGARLDLLSGEETLTKQIKTACDTSTDENCVENFLNQQNIALLNIANLHTFISRKKDDPVTCSIKGGYSETFCKKKFAINTLSHKNTEKHNILENIERGGGKIIVGDTTTYTAHTGEKPLPYFNTSLVVNTDSSISFKESINNDDYWINLDPEQGCSPAPEIGPKILLKVEYIIPGMEVKIFLENVEHFTGPPFRQNSDGSFNYDRPFHPFNMSNGIDMNIDAPYKGSKYFLTPKTKVAEQIALYPTLTWPDISEYGGERASQQIEDIFIIKMEIAGNIYRQERDLFLNTLGVSKNFYMKIKETYLLPIRDVSKNTVPDGDVKNKIKDIFNLKETNQLYVQFRKQTRKLRGYDRLYDTYTPNKYGELRKSVKPPLAGKNITNFAIWKAIDVSNGKVVPTPNYYIWQNEMIFRAFFGSSDAAEHGNNIFVDSKDPADWIPYDFYKKAPEV